MAEHAARPFRETGIVLDLAIEPDGLVIRAAYPNPEGSYLRDRAILEFAELSADPRLARRTVDALATKGGRRA